MRTSSRRRGGPPPDSPCDVALVIQQNAAASPAAIKAAVAAATDRSIAVVLPLRIHGYAFGLPNPGLMPTARERTDAEAAISETVRRLTRMGMSADGHIIVTRNAAKAVRNVARRRTVKTVVVEQRALSTLRRLVEGDLCRQLRRRLGGSIVVESVQAATATAAQAGRLGVAPA